MQQGGYHDARMVNRRGWVLNNDTRQPQDALSAAVRYMDVQPDVGALADGLTRMAEWAKQGGPTEPGKRFEVELAKNLPASWA